MSATLLADTTAPLPAAANPLQSPDFLFAAGLLASALLVGAGAVWAAERWRRRQTVTPGEAVEAFTSFRTLFDRGELSREEYERIRAKMATKIKQDVTAGTPAVGRNPTPGEPPAASADRASGGDISPPAGRPAAGPPPTDPA